MENENLKPVEKLTSFTKMCMTIGTLPSSFYASMDYYESMVWLYGYLKNEIIPAINNNSEVTQELQTAFTELENYVQNTIIPTLSSFNERLDNHDERLDNHDERLDTQEERLDTQEERLDTQEERLDNQEETITTLENNLEITQNDLEDTKAELDKYKTIYNVLPKVIGEGEIVTLNNTGESILKLDLNGNTSQNGEPTPSSPIPINVVSGDNEITISNSDNTQSQTYSIYLGELELCKIGDYQDYFTKNSDGEWCKYNAIGKVVLDGSETWGLSATYTNNTRFNSTSIILGKTTPLLSNYFLEGVGGTDTTNIDTNGSNGQLMITIPNNIASTIVELQTWLSTHNTIVYYVLETPYLSLIEDETLISQLDAIENAMSYEGTTNIGQVNNDKAFIIFAKALQMISSE